MHKLLNSNRPVSSGQTSWEDGDSEPVITNKLYYKDLIARANSVSLQEVLKKYGFNLNRQNRKITCPFRHHNEGRENSASFYYYPDTDTFWCFGCKTGSKPIDFVSNIENITIVQAANKILQNFDDGSIVPIENNNYLEKVGIFVDFSNYVREFIHNHTNQESAIVFVEEVCNLFDKLYLKYSLNNKALKSLTHK